MAHTPGATSAELLVRLGLGRGAVVDALMREIGLTSSEAERAWWQTSPSYQAVHSGRFARHFVES